MSQRKNQILDPAKATTNPGGVHPMFDASPTWYKLRWNDCLPTKEGAGQ